MKVRRTLTSLCKYQLERTENKIPLSSPSPRLYWESSELLLSGWQLLSPDHQHNMPATELWCQRNCNTAFEISELTLAVTQHSYDRNCSEGDLWLCISGKGSCSRAALLPLPVGQLITCMSLSWQESTGLSPPPAPEAPLSLWGVSPVLAGV